MNTTHTAEIISVGTELLLGNVVNTDARDISERLSELGINVYYHTVVGDNPERLAKAVNIARERADIIITTGGLGPTCDDLTKQVLASTFGLELRFNEGEAERIRGYFSNFRHSSMTENNLQQAMLPEGCTIFHNEWGTAPGCAFNVDGVTVIMLPGPPSECNAMFTNCAMPYLRGLSDYEIVSHSIHIFGEGESAVEDKLRDLMNELENPTLAPYAKEGEVMLRVTAKARTHQQADDMMQPVIGRVRSVLGDIIYGVDAGSLEQTVFDLLAPRGMTLASAESCTGGLLAKRITDLPGASSVFAGGVTAYSIESKTTLLGIPADLVAEKGAASADIAIEMARSIRKKLGADAGIGITGVAGPSPDGKREVGNVFVALSVPGQDYVREVHLGFGRSRIRTASVNHAFDMLRRHLTGLPVTEL